MSGEPSHCTEATARSPSDSTRSESMTSSQASAGSVSAEQFQNIKLETMDARATPPTSITEAGSNREVENAHFATTIVPEVTVNARESTPLPETPIEPPKNNTVDMQSVVVSPSQNSIMEKLPDPHESSINLDDAQIHIRTNSSHGSIPEMVGSEQQSDVNHTFLTSSNGEACKVTAVLSENPSEQVLVTEESNSGNTQQTVAADSNVCDTSPVEEAKPDSPSETYKKHPTNLRDISSSVALSIPSTTDDKTTPHQVMLAEARSRETVTGSKRSREPDETQERLDEPSSVVPDLPDHCNETMDDADITGTELNFTGRSLDRHPSRNATADSHASTLKVRKHRRARKPPAAPRSTGSTAQDPILIDDSVGDILGSVLDTITLPDKIMLRNDSIKVRNVRIKKLKGRKTKLLSTIQDIDKEVIHLEAEKEELKDERERLVLVGTTRVRDKPRRADGVVMWSESAVEDQCLTDTKIEFKNIQAAWMKVLELSGLEGVLCVSTYNILIEDVIVRSCAEGTIAYADAINLHDKYPPVLKIALTRLTEPRDKETLWEFEDTLERLRRSSQVAELIVDHPMEDDENDADYEPGAQHKSVKRRRL
jgi:hypothetical protein